MATKASASMATSQARDDAIAAVPCVRTDTGERLENGRHTLWVRREQMRAVSVDRRSPTRQPWGCERHL